MMMKNSTKLLIILALAFGFRLVLMQWRFAIGFDEPHYLQMGAAAVQHGLGALLHPYWPPMYPALVALFSLFGSDVELAGRLVNIVCGTLTLVPVFVLARALFGEKPALLSVLLLAIFPAFAFSATDALSESSYTFFSMSGLAAGWFALQRKSLRQAGMAGLFFGMAYLTKPEGLGYLGVFVGFALLWLFYRIVRFKKFDLVKIIATATAVVILVALPYLVYLKNATGDWTISGKYKVNRFDVTSINKLSPDNKHLPLDMAYHLGTFADYDPDTHAGDDGHARSLGALAAWFAQNLYKIFRSELAGAVTAPMFLLMVLGLFAGRWTWPQTRLQLYLLSYIVFFWLMVIPFFHINARYFAPLLPLCFVWIGQGTDLLFRRFQNFFEILPFKQFPLSTDFAGKVMLTIVVITTSFLPEMGKIVARSADDRDFWADAVELKRAGDWLKANTSTTPVLMSYNKSVDFYAGQTDVRNTATFSFDPPDRVVQYARHRHVSHIVLSERYRPEFPNLEPLWQDEQRPGLRRVYDEAGDDGMHVLIYEILPVEPEPTEEKTNGGLQNIDTDNK